MSDQDMISWLLFAVFVVCCLLAVFADVIWPKRQYIAHSERMQRARWRFCRIIGHQWEPFDDYEEYNALCLRCASLGALLCPHCQNAHQ